MCYYECKELMVRGPAELGWGEPPLDIGELVSCKIWQTDKSYYKQSFMDMVGKLENRVVK